MNPLQEYISENPGITISSKRHEPGCGQCILELCSQALGKDWTDDPYDLELPDIRALNDAAWSSDAMRTEHMLRVGVAVWPWREASRGQQQLFIDRLAELTIRRVLPPVLREARLNDVADRCEREGNKEAAEAATNAARSADNAALAAAYIFADKAAIAAARAALAADNAVLYAAFVTAYAAAREAASAAARAARATTNPDAILIIACDCWVEASKELAK